MWGQMALRDYQIKWIADVNQAWDEGAQNVFGTLPTGGGKTVCFSTILKEKDQPACLISHRQELVAQASLTLNREQVPHSIIAPQKLVSEIIKAEIDAHGKSYYQPRAVVRIAGVNTLVVRDNTDRWFSQVKYVVVDEGHHVQEDNIFGKAVMLFPNARGLFPSAHCIRADGSGLGRGAGGLADKLVVGPSARRLIERGFLVDYRLIAPPSDVNISHVPLSSTGDFNPNKLRAAMHESTTIVGDVVREYIRFAGGKLGLTFAVDIEHAQELKAAYWKAHVNAEIVTGETSISDRSRLMRDFRAKKILQLVSVDVLGEGTDVPVVEVVSMGRPTHSFQLYSQQDGRKSRVSVREELAKIWDTFTDQERLDHIAASDKPKGILIDHVGNWSRHGLPDIPRRYTLAAREKRSKREGIPLKLCINIECLQPYEAFHPQCPYCGTKPIPKTRGTPEAVEGDLTELDPAVLDKMRKEIERINNPPLIPANASYIIAGSIKKNHQIRQDSQYTLRSAIALWAGYWKSHNAADVESYRRFFHMFGFDIMSAQALGSSDAKELETNIRAEIERLNIIEAADAGTAISTQT
jgi:DNA repair protein RadD